VEKKSRQLKNLNVELSKKEKSSLHNLGDIMTEEIYQLG